MILRVPPTVGKCVQPQRISKFGKKNNEFTPQL